MHCITLRLRVFHCPASPSPRDMHLVCYSLLDLLLYPISISIVISPSHVCDRPRVRRNFTRQGN